MTPYTQLIQVNKEFKLISAIYRNTPAGVRRVIVLERTIPKEAFTSDGGVMLNVIDQVAHHTLSRRNSNYKFHVVFHDMRYSNGYKYAATMYGNMLKHDRILDMMIDVLTRYGLGLASKREIVREYF